MMETLRRDVRDALWAYQRDIYRPVLGMIAAGLILVLTLAIGPFLILAGGTMTQVGMAVAFILGLGAYMLWLYACGGVEIPVWVWTQHEPSGRCYRYRERLRDWFGRDPANHLPVNGRQVIQLWAGRDKVWPPVGEEDRHPLTGHELMTALQELPPIAVMTFEGDPHFGEDLAQAFRSRCRIWEPEKLTQDLNAGTSAADIVKWGVFLAVFGGMLAAALILPGMMRDMALNG